MRFKDNGYWRLEAPVVTHCRTSSAYVHLSSPLKVSVYDGKVLYTDNENFYVDIALNTRRSAA